MYSGIVAYFVVRADGRCGVLKFLANQKGTAELTLLLLAMLLILGVLGCDFSRAFSVQARLQTAADAATLAACNEAEIKGTRIEEMWDANGNRTDDPNQAVKIVSRWVEKWVDLSGREIQANTAAQAAFAKNLSGENAPMVDVAVPPVPGISGAKIFTSPAYAYSSGIAYDQPKTAPDGSTYYDTYKVSSAEAGVKAFLAGNWFRKHDGQDILAPLADPGQQWDKRTIPIKVKSSAQAIVASD